MLYHFAAMKNALVRHVVFLLLAASLSAAQGQNAGSLKTEYLDDFAETCKHLDQLSQAMPANKYAWRPGAGVRSVSEVYVHIANGNFLLLSLTGVKLPAEYFPSLPPGAKGKQQELTATGDDPRMRKKIEDDFTPRLEAHLVGLEGSVRRQLSVKGIFELGTGHEYTSSIDVIPSENKITKSPE